MFINYFKLYVYLFERQFKYACYKFHQGSHGIAYYINSFVELLGV